MYTYRVVQNFFFFFNFLEGNSIKFMFGENIYEEDTLDRKI